MKLKKNLVTAVAAAILVWFPASGFAANSIDKTNTLARQFIQQTMQELRIPGLQIAVIKDNKIVLSDSYGLANVENQIPATKTTLFPINSATKTFTGVAMMQLVEAGKIDLNAPVSQYLTDLPEAWRTIRIRQLLAHTSGLPDIVDQNGLIGGGNEQAAWHAVKKLPSDAASGEQFAYNQTNYGLLSLIIEKQTGIPYAQYITKQQFLTANMPLSTFGDSYDLIPNAATIYSYTPRGTMAKDDNHRLSHWIYDMPYSLWAGGGIQSTADEVARWLISLQQGKLINATHVNAMWTPEKLNNGKEGDWAAGWPVLQTAPRRQIAGIGGARAAFIVYPDDRLAIVILTNLAGANPQRFIPQLAKIYLPE